MLNILKALFEFLLSLAITVIGLLFAALLIASLILGGIGPVLVVLGG